MANTYVAISTVTVGSGGTASIEFTSIPQTYNDLCLVVSARSETNNTGNLWCQINGSTATLPVVLLYGDGAAASGAISAGSDYIWNYSVPANYTANTFSNNEYYFPDYTTSIQKVLLQSGVTENNATTAFAVLSGARYSSVTAAITSIKLSIYFSGDIAEYSTATLYGIRSS